MRTLLRRIVFFALTALVVPMVAFATPPTTEPITFDDTFVYAPGTDENPCSFELTYHNEGTYLVTTHLDSSGVAVRQFARGIDFVETYSANGKAISSRTGPSRVSRRLFWLVSSFQLIGRFSTLQSRVVASNSAGGTPPSEV